MHEQLRGRDHPAKGDIDAAVAFDEERAAALGRAGRRLQAAVDAFRAAERVAATSPAVLDHLLDEVAAQVWRLVLQRECAGARAGNLEAIARAYDVPPAALRRV